MPSMLKKLIPVALCFLAGATVTFFAFGIIHNDGSTFLSGILSGLMWIVFGFYKWGVVNTTTNHQLVYHNLWPYILATTCLFMAVTYWRLRSKTRMAQD